MPTVIEVVATMATMCVLIWRHRRRSPATLALATVLGATVSLAAFATLTNTGLSGEAAPSSLWAWTFATGFAAAAAMSGWRAGTGWWRNGAAFASAMCLLSTGLVVNGWIGYLPTTAVAWEELTDQPLPHQIDARAAFAMRSRGELLREGRIVEVDTDDQQSGFRHRVEWVYLPPSWFRNAKATPPVVMMIAGEFSTPADWVRVGQAVATTDDYAAAHDGHGPILVFPDANGSFGNDTECVNGSRGRAADHLTREVVPAVASRFGTGFRHWAVAGFSSGGTCAVDLAVRKPELFDRFVDIAGDERPNAGTEAQTLRRLFSGDRQAQAAFDPGTVMVRHGAYSDTAGLFIVPRSSRSDAQAAQRLWAVGSRQGIRCSVATLPGRHTWPFVAAAFQTALPWLAGLPLSDAESDVS